METKKILSNYMAMMGELFDKNVSSTLMEAYWKALEPYSDAEVETAFKRLVTTARFFPKPAEVLEAINGPQVDQAVLAWQRVDKAVREHGPYESVQFDDAAIHGAIELMGGWVQFQNVHVDEWKWKQKDFERLYPIMKRRGNHPKYLPGIFEMENIGRGYKTDPPVQIGGGEKPTLKLVEKTEEREG